MKIADYKITSGAFVAPMAGVTDVAFRNICIRYKAALTCTEMVSVQGLFYQPKKSMELIESDCGTPQVVQVFGAQPKMVAEMVNKYCTNFDIIDINMGCPAPKIVKGGAGSALMQTPEVAFDIVKAVADKTGKPVTCKIRSGWDDDSINAVDFAGGLERAGVSLVALHARTRMQYYSGKADRELIRKTKQALSIPLVGNGDVKSAQDAKQMMELTGCDAVMVGRSAQGRPYIFRQIHELLENGKEWEAPGLKERMADALEHAEGLSAQYGEKKRRSNDAQASCVVYKRRKRGRKAQEYGRKSEFSG